MDGGRESSAVAIDSPKVTQTARNQLPQLGRWLEAWLNVLAKFELERLQPVIRVFLARRRG